jgi:response regulator NasT
LRNILTTAGHTLVGEAGDGQQVVQLACETNPDLVILNVRLPVLGGLEATRQIHDHCPVPLIVLSSQTEPGLCAEAAAAGASACLVKPFNAEQLGPVIEMALVNFEKSRQLEQRLEQMSEALETRKIVERAKGILMRQTTLDEESAYRKLQKTARNKNRKLVEIAREVIVAEQARRQNSQPAASRCRPPPPA